ncbi:hypothetical protein BC835DRAFT_1518254 [Cytidiella melzeri]|nr:hypothetical protein BC835DRAFT_1518254 [Cytidiella melzeri]
MQFPTSLVLLVAAVTSLFPMVTVSATPWGTKESQGTTLFNNPNPDYMARRSTGTGKYPALDPLRLINDSKQTTPEEKKLLSGLDEYDLHGEVASMLAQHNPSEPKDPVKKAIWSMLQDSGQRQHWLNRLGEKLKKIPPPGKIVENSQEAH